MLGEGGVVLSRTHRIGPARVGPIVEACSGSVGCLCA
jgi:hypothetical protein